MPSSNGSSKAARKSSVAAPSALGAEQRAAMFAQYLGTIEASLYELEMTVAANGLTDEQFVQTGPNESRAVGAYRSELEERRDRLVKAFPQEAAALQAATTPQQT